MQRRVLVTGATGFVGRTLCETLASRGYIVRAVVRADGALPACIAERTIIGDINSTTDWGSAFQGVDFVIHAAARAHVLSDAASNSDLYTETNAFGTRRLANQAALAGVQRFVYLSSIKVNGEETVNRSYTSVDEPQPQDAYGRSKLQAEQFLTEVGVRTGMEIAMVRSPLVYGPGVRANFLRLMRWVDNGWPLPLGSVANKRSLVSIWNLCDLLVCLLEHLAADGVWMVSDDHDLSTAELVRKIATAMHRPARLLPIPVCVLRLGGSLIGRRQEIMRLCGSLRVDLAQTRHRLGWSPPMATEEAIERTVRWFLTEGRMRDD